MKPMIVTLSTYFVLISGGFLCAQDADGDPLKQATDMYRLSQAVHRNLVELGQKMQAAQRARDLQLMAKLQEESLAQDSRLRTFSVKILKLLDQSLSKEPQAKAYFIRAQIHARDGGLSKAVTDLSQAIKIDPQNTSYVLLRARIYQTMPGMRKASLADLNTVAAA